MNDALIQVKVNDADFGRLINKVAALSNTAVEDEGRNQGKLLCGELIQRTPPFSGKSIKKMTAARGATFTDFEIEDATALKVGERRVEKDIRKVVYGLEGASLSARHMQVSRGANPGQTDWGTLQKVEGKQAVRVFATKSGTVYGADVSQWMPQASISELTQHVNAQRGAKGRVTMAGQKTRDVGRWRWLNVLVTTEAIVAQFVALKKKMVGQAKGGWADGFMKLGGRMSAKGWIGRHSSAGKIRADFGSGSFDISVVNESAWASGGDPDRVIPASLAGRARALEGNIKSQLDSIWKNVKRAA